MERKMYQLTESQQRRFANKPTQKEVDVRVAQIRAGECDEGLKADWKRRHHGKVTGWGMAKAQLINVHHGRWRYL